MNYHCVDFNDLDFCKSNRFNKLLLEKDQTIGTNYDIFYKGVKLKIKTPIVKFPFGIEYHKGKYKLTAEINPKSNFLKFILHLEKKVIEHFEEQINFNSSIKLNYKTHNPLLTGIKIPFRYKKIETKFFKNRECMASRDFIKGSKGSIVLELNNIWISSDSTCGILWSAKEIKI